MLRILWIMLLGMGLTFAQTAAFPGAIATTADLLVAKDRSASTLTSGINASTLTVPVVAGAQFVAYGIVTIDTEQMQICSIASNVLTICNGKRGFGGTTAATHSSGAAVRGNIAAWHHNALSAELRAVQTALGANLANIRYNAADYAFAAQSPGGTLTAATPATVTLTPCPAGVSHDDTAHYLWVSAGTGTAEAVLITGGNCTSGAATGTIIFTPVNNHSGAWTIASATGGIQEAVNVAAAWSIVRVVAPVANQYVFGLRAKVTVGKHLIIEGSQSTLNIYRTADYPNGDLFSITSGNVTFRNHSILAGAPGHATGAAFRYASGTVATLTDVVINNGQYGVILDGTGMAQLTRVVYLNGTMDFKAAAGLYVTGGAIHTYITDSQFYGYPTTNANVLSYGIRIDNADGVWAQNTLFYGGTGIYVDLTGGIGFVVNLQFNSCQVDDVRNHALLIEGNGKIGGSFKFTGNHFHSQGNGTTTALLPVVAIGYAGTIMADDIILDGNNIMGGHKEGLWIGATGKRSLLVVNNIISSNNRSNTAGISGVRVVTGVTGLTFTGNSVQNDVYGYQKYGLHLAGSLGKSVIAGNNLSNNVTGPFVADAPNYTDVSIAGNAPRTTIPGNSTLSADGTQTYITTSNLTFIDGLNRLKVGYGAVTNNVVEAQVLADSVAGNLLLSSRTNYASGIFFYTNAATAAVERMRIGSDGNVVIGGLVQATGVTLATTAAPTCAAGIRGRFNYVAGGVGVKDIIQVCGKAANNTYAWVAIY